MKKFNRTKLEKNKYKFILFPRIVFSLFILAIVFILPLIILSGSKSFFLNGVERSNCYEMISEHDCKNLSINVLNFLKGKETLDERYTASEQSHFYDVRNILNFAKVLALFLVVFVVLYFIILYFFDVKEIFNTLRLSGWMIIIFLGLLLLMITISFQGTFFAFHRLIFPQGNWTFPFDFTIITVFPEAFFVRAAFISFLFSLAGGLLLLGISYLEKCRK